MPTPYNHCTKCGEELTQAESEIVSDVRWQMPPLCSECVNATFHDLAVALSDAVRPAVESFRTMSKELNEAVKGAFRPDQ